MKCYGRLVGPKVWTDQVGEYVLLGVKEKAFGLSVPGYALQHWWIKTPNLEASTGPASAIWGTEGKTMLVKITDHASFADRDSPDVPHYFLRIHGPEGFTASVERQLAIGKPLGLLGIKNNCQTLCRKILLEAGADHDEVPHVFTFGRALGTLMRNLWRRSRALISSSSPTAALNAGVAPGQCGTLSIEYPSSAQRTDR